ncbi:histone [Candidatus Bathyarchaeota archaeon]|nr:NFYB/HAP3 family transcription factor subunit [Candidatus Bathyarchaeota archaeon]RJS88560.1 MAG: histone [Candidatus Bathyarchaeota archaeon]RLI33238.1 MAG: histone [Candidatus Bathyarchaeota archaeon]
MPKIKVAPMHELIKRAGAERVSKEGALALGKVLEEIGLKIAKEAIDWAHHAGRKTVKAEDIEMAVEKILKR